MIPDQLLGPSITLKDVSLQAEKVCILKRINCEFGAGQWHGIIGPNGGGKSSLLKSILGLNGHTGSIEINWPDMTSKKAGKPFGDVGYIPQTLPFDRSLPISVRDYLLMSLSHKPVWFRRSLPKEVHSSLAQVRLENKLDRKLGDLSGGERQRLMLTVALLKKPQLLILDEPMTGLDEKGKAEALTILEAFKHAGGTLLMVEHDWQVVEKHCDQLAWINQLLQYQGRPDRFFEANPGFNQSPVNPINLLATKQPSAEPVTDSCTAS